MAELRVAVLASHTGTNLRALHAASLAPDTDFRIVLVISNNSGSGALAFAREQRIPALHLSGRTHSNPANLDEAMRGVLMEYGTELVVTAGYMKHVGPRTRKEFAGRIINVHPALLPRHGGHGMYGQRVHRAVLESGDTVSGPTVHLVDEDYDTGKTLAQTEVPVLTDDTVETLGARVLAAEHLLLPTVVQQIATGHQANL
ncbi:phosphoribosylglycinamide formyltransferase [Nocardia sp. NPDC050710]|uniref:phosphoribosylglycinamide formyltransferase n=1 Tax=Nocardia sp. NPDC050710 TaxID=3157220 RepID=UPI0033E4AC30